MNIPDLIGYTLDEAQQISLASGMKIGFVKVASAPKEELRIPDGQYRVVRVRLTEDEQLELLVCKPL